MTNDRDVMIDIETLATCHNAAVIQVGACTFDESETFLGSVDRSFYDDWAHRTEPFVVDPKTVEWWSTQSKEAQDSLKMNLYESIDELMYEFTDWLRECAGLGFKYNGKQGVWANPPQFDLTILRNALGYCDIKCPWHYRQERCARTIWREFGEKFDAHQDGYGLIAHRADHDAIRQARGIRRALEALKNERT